MLPKPKPEQVKTELGAIALCIAANLTFLLGCATAKGRFSGIEFLLFVGWGEVWFTGITIWLLRHHFAVWGIKVTREAYKDRIEIHEHMSKLDIGMFKSDQLRLLIQGLIETTEALQTLLMDIEGKPPVTPDHVDKAAKDND